MLRFKAIDDTSPIDGGFLEIHEKAQRFGRRFRVIETLGGVLVGQAVDTLEFDYEGIFDENVGEVVSDHGLRRGRVLSGELFRRLFQGIRRLAC